ncbi:MAG: exodeoxyribonuclease VII small subunit [Clostridia bacterium]|nr:exodeoxyribonuclease VII small subunit [Clostridia bacterium]
MEERITFEQAMEKLNTIAAKLEEGDCSLEEMIALSQEGNRLSQLCETMLNDYEQKITKLNQTGEEA